MMSIFDGITKKIMPLQDYPNFMFKNKKEAKWGPAKNRKRFCHRIYCNLFFLIVLAKILFVLTHFVLNSDVKQRQYSELSLGKRARPQLSTYL